MNVPSKIDALIAKYLNGEALPHEAIELEDWCNQQPENRTYFDEMVKTLSLIDGNKVVCSCGVCILPSVEAKNWN
jgi:hypothetical protein